MASVDSSRSGRAARLPRSLSSWTPALLGFGLALAVCGIWVGLTVLTGKTYHLAPLLAAMAPGYAARGSGLRSTGSRQLGVATAIGLVAVALGWIVIVALDAEPTATLVEGLPGNVLGEVVVGALAGALIGALAFWWKGRAAGVSPQ